MDLRGQLGYKGERGYSAYEIAVQNGYEGTEAEWVDSFLNAENYYNKSETDTLLATKANTSDVYTKGNLAIVSGSYTTETGTSAQQIHLNYPTGFTKDNCIVASVMMRNATQNFWGTGSVMTLNSTVTGEVLDSVTLASEDITLYVRNLYVRAYTSETNPQVSEMDLPSLDFKVVLFKYDVPEEEGD